MVLPRWNGYGSIWVRQLFHFLPVRHYWIVDEKTYHAQMGIYQFCQTEPYKMISIVFQHNFWIFLNLILCLILFYSFHKSARRPEKEREKEFAKDMLDTYKPCLMVRHL